jgi:hypothetical protein
MPNKIDIKIAQNSILTMGTNFVRHILPMERVNPFIILIAWQGKVYEILSI